MLENKMRPALELVLIAPLAKILLRFAKITPLVISLAAIGCAIAVVPLMRMDLTSAALICLWLSYMASLVNGRIALSSEKVNTVGTLYDFYALRIIEFVMIFGLYLLNSGIIAWISLLILAGNFLAVSSALAVGILTDMPAEEIFYKSSGLLDRLELFLIFSVIIVFPVTYGVLGIALVVLLLCTAAFRVLEYQRR